jgi:hypothetical protein
VSISVTGGHVLFFVVNVTCVDFVAFAFTIHFNNNRSISEKCVYNFYEADTGFRSEAIIVVLSANVVVSVLMFVGKSAV